MEKPSTMSELASACGNWKGPTEDGATFAQIVRSYLDLSGNDQRVLADKFEAAVSSVSRWANGIVQPRPFLQKLVVAWIEKHAARAAQTATERPRRESGSRSAVTYAYAAKSNK